MTGTGNEGFIPEREAEKRLPRPRMAAGAEIVHSSVRRQLRTVIQKSTVYLAVRNAIGGQVWCQQPR